MGSCSSYLYMGEARIVWRMTGGEVLYNLIRDMMSLERRWEDLPEWERRAWEAEALRIALTVEKDDLEILNEIRRWDYATG